MTDDKRPVLRAEQVWRTYRQGALEVHALRDLSVSIHAGDFAVLAGPSGSGKTTLLNLFGALDVPTQGQVWVDGEDLSRLTRRDRADLRRDRLGFVFQSYNLVPVLTAFENAELILLLQGVPQGERARRVDALLERVGLGGLGGRYPSELSGGQQQRVAVARALAAKPALVLADEPTANLDSATGTALIDMMRSLNADLGTTFVFSSHDQKVIERARRLILLKDGAVAQDTTSG
ncbi:MAG: ABC transporter ATP-binding protein [Alphaproteobacteria bacterium]|nr:ABC transporter ATP-binding protein [Alphaproteobacteria bacterium]